MTLCPVSRIHELKISGVDIAVPSDGRTSRDLMPKGFLSLSANTERTTWKRNRHLSGSGHEPCMKIRAGAAG